jgi:Na+-translocating ferredoxin:NAD+ oxidoreductase RnfG subunit
VSDKVRIVARAERGCGKGPARLARKALLLAAWSALAGAGRASGKVFLTQEEALRLAFPEGVTVERRTAFLTDAEQREVQKLARTENPPEALVAYYVGRRNGQAVGTAYFDTHQVRTMPETILVLVDPAGSVLRVEVLSFLEPEDYLPMPRWYGQFAGRPLDDELSLKKGIHPVAGATLTARATTEAVRRVLALDRLLRSEAAAPR